MDHVDVTPQAARQQRRDIVLGLAGLLASAHFSPGDRAELRRLEPGDFNRPAFWRWLVQQVPEHLRRTETAEAHWAMLLHGMALMAPQHHQTGRQPGRALAEADFPEARLEQLLRARGPQVWPALRRLCQFLAARATPLDWVDFSSFVLAEHEDRAEEQRRRIARSYYAALAHKDDKKE
jgi:hypothetical protein